MVGAVEESLTAKKTGTYQLAVTVGGCTVVSSPVEIYPGSSRVFPNPVRDKMTVDLTGLSDSDGFLYIFNLSGDIVYQVAFEASTLSKEVLVNDIKPGIHLLRVVSGTGTVVMESRIVIR